MGALFFLFANFTSPYMRRIVFIRDFIYKEEMKMTFVTGIFGIIGIIILFDPSDNTNG